MSGCFEDILERIPVPYITCIKECRAEQFPDDGEAELKVRLEFEIPGMEEVLVVLGRIEVTGSIRIG